MTFYINWTNEGSHIEEELERYVEDRAYGTDSADLVVNALANSLCITIRILELGATGEEYTLHTLPQVPGRRLEQPGAVIDVLKSGEHYDALVATNTKPSGTFLTVCFSFRYHKSLSFGKVHFTVQQHCLACNKNVSLVK